MALYFLFSTSPVRRLPSLVVENDFEPQINAKNSANSYTFVHFFVYVKLIIWFTLGSLSQLSRGAEGYFIKFWKSFKTWDDNFQNRYYNKKWWLSPNLNFLFILSTGNFLLRHSICKKLSHFALWHWMATFKILN